MRYLRLKIIATSIIVFSLTVLNLNMATSLPVENKINTKNLLPFNSNNGNGNGKSDDKGNSNKGSDKSQIPIKILALPQPQLIPKIQQRVQAIPSLRIKSRT